VHEVFFFRIGNGKQILMKNIQCKNRSNSDRKMFKTINAQIVMTGMLNPQIHIRPSFIPPALVGSPFSMALPSRCSSLNRSSGMAKATLGLSFFRSETEGRVIFTGGRPALSYQGAILNGSLGELHTNNGGHPSERLMRTKARTE